MLLCNNARYQKWIYRGVSLTLVLTALRLFSPKIPYKKYIPVLFDKGWHKYPQSSKTTENLPSSIVNSETRVLQKRLPSPFITHIRFLKVHKAGSTTLQNMLFRFAIRYNLNLLLPKGGNQLLQLGHAVRIPEGEHFDIFAVHSIFRTDWFNSILPRDVVNIAIVREPIQRFISAAYYFRDVMKVSYLNRIPRENYIHNLVQHPDIYDKGKFSRTKNDMARDFGFSPRLTIENTTEINSYMRFLDTQFFLVLITERFDESLVLLRRLMNWSLADIVYVRANSHEHTAETLTAEEKVKLKRTCFLDNAVYEYFLQRFEDRLRSIGPDFYEEVRFFNSVLAQLDVFCKGNERGPLFVERSPWNDGFNVTIRDCSTMIKDELKLIDELRNRHRQKFSQQ